MSEGPRNSSDEREQPASDAEARPDRVQKSPQTILAREIEAGLVELQRPASGLFLSGLAAGLDIGFGPFLMAAVLTLSRGDLAPPLLQLLVAVAYSIGFVFVIVGQSALFTEQTTLATLPVVHGRASWRQLAKVWGVIYTSNLLGVALFGALAVVLGTRTEIVSPAVLGEIAHGITRYEWWVILLGGVLAGWLMGLLSWLARATSDTMSLITVIVIVTGAIGYAHLPHSIAGTMEVLMGVFSGETSIATFWTFLVWATIGNVIGGTVFVTLLRYSHAQRGGYEPESVVIETEAEDEDDY